MTLAVASNVGNKVNQMGNFKELYVGAGSTILFKANKDGCFSGAGNYSGAPLKWNNAGIFRCTGAFINGNITATGGSITGDMSVTGILTAGSLSGLSLKVRGDLGSIDFLYNNSRVGYILGISSGNMAVTADNNLFLTANNTTQVLMLVGAAETGVSVGDVWMRTSSSKLYWSSGRYLKDDGSQITCNGKFVATTAGGDADIQSQRDIIAGRDVKCGSNGRFKFGTDSGVTESHSGVTDFDIEIKGGIITGFTKN